MLIVETNSAFRTGYMDDGAHGKSPVKLWKGQKYIDNKRQNVEIYYDELARVMFTSGLIRNDLSVPHDRHIRNALEDVRFASEDNG